MKLKTRKSLISQTKHSTTKYTINFSIEKLIKHKNQTVIGVVFLIIYNIMQPHYNLKLANNSILMLKLEYMVKSTLLL